MYFLYQGRLPRNSRSVWCRCRLSLGSADLVWVVMPMRSAKDREGGIGFYFMCIFRAEMIRSSFS